MKALIVNTGGQLEFAELPIPEPGPYQALVAIEVCGICNSTDLKLIEGKMSWGPARPFAIGHESVGRVVKVGERVKSFGPGDRVTRPIYLGGGINSANGGFSEYGLVTDAKALADDGNPAFLNDYNAQRQLVVPEGMSARDAALCISLSETASVLRHLPNPRGMNVVIAGTGVAGLAFALWFKLAGAYVIVLGRREERLQKAREMGADVTFNTNDPTWPYRLMSHCRIDGLVEATGDAALATQLSNCGTTAQFATAYGVPATGNYYDAKWTISPVEEHLSFFWVVDMMRRGVIRPTDFVSHEWEFGEAVEAFEQMKRGEVVKGFVRIGGS